MSILALETSTSAAKALLYDIGKGILAVESESYGADIDQGGKQDAEGVYQAMLRAGKKVAAGREVSAIALGGIWHSIVACDNQMNPVERSHVWTFTGTSDICKNIREDTVLSREIYQRTGCMPNITYQPYTIRYLADNGLDLKNKRFCSQASYNFFRMTDEWMETKSIVSGMGLLNTHEWEYDSLILEYMKIDAKQLGPLGTYRDYCPLNQAAAASLGVAVGIPVVSPHPDGALNQVGNGATKPGIMTFSIGTSAAMRISTDRPILSDPPATWCYVGVEGWLSGAAIAGACNCINWFKEKVHLNQLGFSELEKALLAESTGPIFLPFLFGERCPGWQDERKGGFQELSGDTTVQDMYRAICEGIVFSAYQCYEILTAQSNLPKNIILSGGVLNSEKWIQLTADIFNFPMELSQSPHASLLGGVALALCATGELKNPSDFSLPVEHIQNPRKGVVEYYKKKYQNYLNWYRYTKMH